MRGGGGGGGGVKRAHITSVISSSPT